MIRSGGSMFLERITSLKPEDVETALRRALRRRRGSLAAVEQAGAATVFTVVQPDLYAMLLAAEVRFAALLPCHIAAFEEAGSLKLAAVSPVGFARALGRPGLEAAAVAAENFLNEILDEAARPLTLATGKGGHAESGIGATEDQMNVRGTVGQRIDNRGSKVEELAGTGEQDSRGG
jgi:Domain of unknown function DUF302